MKQTKTGKVELCKNLTALKELAGKVSILDRSKNPFYPKDTNGELARLFETYESVDEFSDRDQEKFNQFKKYLKKYATK